MSKIGELFVKDPLALTPEERDLIVAYYKENRDKFTKLKTNKTKRAKVKAITQLEFELSHGEAEQEKEKPR
jgi:hypothetical protein